MPHLAVKLWRRLFPFRCEWCSFKSRTPQGIGKHRKRCAPDLRPMPSSVDWQAMVREFHVALDHGIGHTAGVRNAKLRASLIAEEAGETVAALEAGDLVEVIDGLCDVIYVALGCAIECGIDLAPFFAEVHRSNMAKAGGPLREDGKRLKPPGWKPPDIAGLLAAQIGET